MTAGRMKNSEAFNLETHLDYWSSLILLQKN